MKYKKNLFYFLHFIIFSYNIFLSFSLESKGYFHCPNYYITNMTNIFPHNYSSSISITTKEFLFSDETNLSTNYSHFLVTSKSGIISIISNNSKLFSIDFNKKMYETNIEQTNIINEDKIVLAFEGKLFIVKNNLEVQNFEEFTTPISELVDMTPFSLWFMPDYYFLSSKNYSIIKIIDNNKNKFNFDIEFNLIVFVDYTLICLKDKEQVWNTTITNVYFLNKNEENKIKNKKIKINELMLIYDNNEKFEKNIKNIFGNKLNDILFIHGYDKIRKKYVKIYDFNTFSHIVQNNTDNNIEEQSNNNIINGIEYKNNISEKYDHLDLLIYYTIIAFLLFFSIILIFHNFIYKIFFSISELYKYFINYSENKIIENTNNNKNNEINNNNNNNFNQETNKKESFEIIFHNIQNNFISINTSNENDNDVKERKRTIDIAANEKNMEISNLNKNQENENHNILKSIRKDLNNIKIKQTMSYKNINRIKKIKKSLNMLSFSNSNTELNEVSPNQNLKNKIQNNDSYLNTEKKLMIKNEDINLKKEKSSPSTALTRLEKDFKDITLVKKYNTGNNIGIILKGKHIIDEEIYAIKIKKLSNPNDEQNVINEAKNMTKIHSKHILEYITCWFDKSLGKFEYLFEDGDDKEFSESLYEIDEKYSYSTKNNKKVFKEDNDNNIIKNQISQDKMQDDHYIKQLYEKTTLSDNEYLVNKKKLINIENKYYKKYINEDNKFKYKYKSKNNNYIDDSLIKSKIYQKNAPNLNMYFFIQMEYCQGMTLLEYIINHSKTGIDIKTMYTFTYQIIKSLARIHENKIVHRDINPENIFIDNENSIKIGDFSSAKEIQSSKKRKRMISNKMILSQSMGNIAQEANNCKNEIEIDLDKDNNGSTLYWSPEQEQGRPINKKSDIYAVGLVLYAMCECFSNEKEIRQGIINLKMKKIITDKVKNLYNLQYNLILKMIENEPGDRPDCEKLLECDEMKHWKMMAEENN